MKPSRRAFLAGSGLMTCSYALGLPGRALLAADLAPVMPVEVSMTTSDGIVLRADLFRPAGSAPAPVLLIRTPYKKAQGFSLPAGVMGLQQALAQGFAVLLQDVRGTGVSDGNFVPLADERRDGAEAVAWAAAQPWSNGHVSMIGASYLGFTQWAAAVGQPAALDACVYVNTCADAYRGWYYSFGGPFAVENTDRYAFFVAATAAERHGDAARRKVLMDSATKIGARLHDGGKATAQMLDKDAPWFGDILRHPRRDAFWKDISYAENFGRVKAAGLHIGGWFDFFAASTVSDFQHLQREAATPEARANQYLIMGPWTHKSMSGFYPDHDFGAMAGAQAWGLSDRVMRFLANPLKSGLSRVSFFMMGANEWHEADAFPPRDMVKKVLTLSADHALMPEGTGKSGKISIPFDSADPVPTRGGRLLSNGDIWSEAGPTDQRSIEKRKDVVSFTTSPFPARVDMACAPVIELSVSTDMADADLAVIVTDVAPDGTSRMLCDGIGRLSLREGPEVELSVTPHKIYHLRMELGVTANAFLPGHALRITVAGSNFPNYALNPRIDSRTGYIFLHTGQDTPSTLTLSFKGVV